MVETIKLIMFVQLSRHHHRTRTIELAVTFTIIRPRYTHTQRIVSEIFFSFRPLMHLWHQSILQNAHKFWHFFQDFPLFPFSLGFPPFWHQTRISCSLCHHHASFDGESPHYSQLQSSSRPGTTTINRESVPASVLYPGRSDPDIVSSVSEPQKQVRHISALQLHWNWIAHISSFSGSLFSENRILTWLIV